MAPSKGDQFTKRVSVIAKDDDDQLITGVVMRPYEVDLQGDWETPEQIEQFADGFEGLLENESADGGIMHAVWPSEWLDLEFNGIAGRDDVPDEVEGKVEEGDWVQTWRVNDSELYELIDDEVFSGFSIGARDVEWDGPMDPAQLPEGVGIPDEYDAEERGVWQITDGVVREVSVVDIPAVPDAQILAKDAEKNLGDYLGNQEAFIEEAAQRGHSEEDAERLWSLLTRAMDEEHAGTPGKSFFERMGKAAFSVLPGVSKPDDASVAETQTRTESHKEGRTLSTKNRHSLFASIDAGLDVLEDSGYDHGMTRFTDREDTSFDLSEHTARSWPKPDEDEGDEDDESDAEQSQSTTDMSDDNTDNEVLAELKSLREDIDEMKSDADGGADDDADKNTDGDGDGDTDKDASEEILSEIKDLRDTVEENAERAKENAEAIDAIGKQSGYSTQATGDGEADKNGETDSMEALKGALS